MSTRSRWTEEMKTRLLREREALADRLRGLGMTPTSDEAMPRGATSGGADEGDRAQASERQDVGVAQQERVAGRINRLSSALDRMADGTYGVCEFCGAEIPQARLEALPETTTCLDCQQRLETGSEATAA